MSTDIGKFIKERRTALDKTQRDIANEVGVTEATVSRWESGHIDNMRRDKMASLAKALKISPMQLISDDPAPQQPSADGLPDLSPREERDIERDLEDMMHSVAQADYKAPSDEEDTEALKAALRVAMIQAKRTAKKKYTPRKYRKDK